MVTKEHELKKICCFYVSEYHLEMILLPYIKNNLDKYKILIYTEENLLESVKLLLERINLSESEKEKILKLNWTGDALKNEIDDNAKKIIIINGDINFIKKVNKQFEKRKNLNIVDCYKVTDVNLEISNIRDNYDEILNTKKI